MLSVNIAITQNGNNWKCRRENRTVRTNPHSAIGHTSSDHSSSGSSVPSTRSGSEPRAHQRPVPGVTAFGLQKRASFTTAISGHCRQRDSPNAIASRLAARSTSVSDNPLHRLFQGSTSAVLIALPRSAGSSHTFALLASSRVRPPPVVTSTNSPSTSVLRIAHGASTSATVRNTSPTCFARSAGRSMSPSGAQAQSVTITGSGRAVGRVRVASAHHSPVMMAREGLGFLSHSTLAVSAARTRTQNRLSVSR